MKKGTSLKNMDFITEEREGYAVIIFLFLKNEKPQWKKIVLKKFPSKKSGKLLCKGKI